MTQFLREYLYKKYGKTKKINKILTLSDFIETTFLLLIIGYLFNNLVFSIILSLIIFLLSEYTYHFHCKNLNHCKVLTCTLAVVFYFISNLTPIWVSLFLCVLFIKEMYLKMPLKIVKKEKDEKWHKLRFMRSIMFFLWVALIFIRLDNMLIASYILNSINVYGILFFQNENKFI